MLTVDLLDDASNSSEREELILQWAAHNTEPHFQAYAFNALISLRRPGIEVHLQLHTLQA